MSDLKQIGLSCSLYAADFCGEFPFKANAENSNENFYLLLPNFLTTSMVMVCPTDIANPKPRACRDVNYGEFANFLKTKNVNSYAYVAGLNGKSSMDSPLAGDEIMNPTKANDKSITQYQKRGSCADLGSNHGKAGGNVVFVDGRAVWNSGPKLKIRWVDGTGSASNIFNPK